ncbi:Amastin surface glycoprotein [Trypanosoma melophagium]|uniref:Amastin surface glycoprotein n=1 Tax=Trypanosoma melophagium TaxID=715481 RepID=UPI00351A8EDE|nr:Amastin surface glycoprotein [Trypanosoma melophagium]
MAEPAEPLTLNRDDNRDNSPAPLNETPPRFVPPPLAPPPLREVKIGPPIVFACVLFSFIFLTVAIGTPWFRMEQYAAAPDGGDVVGNYGLWKTTVKSSKVVTVTNTGDITCLPIRLRTKALQGISIGTASLALITSVVALANCIWGEKRKNVGIAAIWCVGITFICVIAECSLGINVYTWVFKECEDGLSYRTRAYEPYVGFAFVAVSWALITIAGLLVYNEPVFLADARSIDFGAFAFTAFAFVAFLFSTVSSPMPQWHYKDAANKTFTEVLLWRERHGILWERNPPTNSTGIRNLGCHDVVPYFRAAETFSIFSVISCFLSVLGGWLLCKKLGKITFLTLFLGYTSIFMTLVQWILATSIYYGNWCNGTIAYHHKKYVLTTGFVLNVTAFVLITLGTCVLTVAEAIRCRYFPTTTPMRTMNEIFIELID